MPRVLQYQPNQTSSEIVNQPRTSAQAGSAVFQANIQAADRLVDITRAGIQIKQRIDTTAAEEALVQFERDKNSMFFNPENGYFNTQGRNAYDGADAASKALDDLKKRYGESLSIGAKTLFDSAADVHISRGRSDISRHASKGLAAWEIATTRAQVENSIENAELYWTQPDKLRVQNELGRQAILDNAQRLGIGAEATNERLQTFDSSFAKAAIRAATTHSSIDGERALDRYSDMLEAPDRAQLERGIANKKQEEKTVSDAQQSVLLGTQLVDTFDDRESIREQVNQIEDPILRKQTMSEAMRQFNLKKQALDEAQADAFERAESHVIAGGSAETFKIEDPQGWNQLSAKQKRNIESGKATITDWNTYSDLMVLPREQLRKVNPVDHFDKLAPPERSKLISAVKSAQGVGQQRDQIDHQIGRTRNSQTTAALEQLLGKKSGWNIDKRQRADAFYSLLDDEVLFQETQKGESLSSTEFTQLLSNMTRKVTLERNFFGIDILVPDLEQDITDIPPENLQTLSRFLRNNGIPVTVDNLVKAQRQAEE